MAERAAARDLRGQPAAPGRAAGRIHVLAQASWHDDAMAAAGDARLAQLDDDEGAQSHDDNGARLGDAIAAARADIARDMAQVTGDAAAMLAAHDALLEDPELPRAALGLMAGGHAVAAAWRLAIEAEAQACTGGGDPAVAARASDFDDLRDRVLAHLLPHAAHPAAIVPGAVVLAADLTLSRFLAHDWTQGGAILLTAGSAAGHVAMLARTRGIPMVVGLQTAGAALNGVLALVDGETGEVVLDPPEDAANGGVAVEAAVPSPHVVQAPGISLALNVNHLDELRGVDPSGFDGIGLVRTELLFQPMTSLPDEAMQYAGYRRLLDWADRRPVIVRVFDVGGDKPLPGLNEPSERNPFLGLRGVRLLLTRPELLRVQLRALARAAAQGDLRVLLPMVTVPAELEAVAAMLDAVVAELQMAGLAARRPPLGIMVETPAAALTIDRFAAAAFLSIGTNDLTQHVMAASRDNAAVAHLVEPLGDAVLRLVASVAAEGRRSGRTVSLCGDAAADPRCTAALMQAGIRLFSLPAQAAAAVAQAARAAGDPS